MQNWKSKKELPYTLLSDPKKELIKFFGASKTGAGSGIIRSHVFVAKGGRVEQSKIKISPADSIREAVEFVEAKPAVSPSKRKAADEDASKSPKKAKAGSPVKESPVKGSPVKGSPVKKTATAAKTKTK